MPYGAICPTAEYIYMGNTLCLEFYKLECHGIMGA